jgi:hypothetical protein
MRMNGLLGVDSIDLAGLARLLQDFVHSWRLSFRTAFVIAHAIDAATQLRDENGPDAFSSPWPA